MQIISQCKQKTSPRILLATAFCGKQNAHICSLHNGPTVNAESMRWVRSSADLESPSSFAQMHMTGTLYKHSVSSEEKMSLIQFDVETYVDTKCFDQAEPQCRNKQHKADSQQVIMSVHWKEKAGQRLICAHFKFIYPWRLRSQSKEILSL